MVWNKIIVKSFERIDLITLNDHSKSFITID